MRKLLLLALLFSSMMISAQTSVSNGLCMAAFKYEINDQLMTPVAATTIHFYDRSSGKVTHWFWNFGDGNTSTEQHPTFTFPHPIGGPTVKISPYKTVTLTVLTADSCKSLYSALINIMEGITYPVEACGAKFKYYQTNYDSIAQTITFRMDNGSFGDSLHYAWNFGDGRTSTEKEPTITFDLSQKERKVCLTIKGSNDCSAEFCDVLYVYPPDKPVDPIDPKPVECETAFGYSVNYNYKTFAPALTLDFYSKAYPEPVKWNWDFGDGTTSTEANPTHSFNYPLGSDSTQKIATSFRTVCLKVETITGCLATYCKTIDIYMNTTPVDPVPQCQAYIKYYPATDLVTIPEVVAYRLVDASEGEVISRIWTFEDGTTSTEAELTKTFDIFKPKHPICLTIKTKDGCVSKRCEVIYLPGIVPPDSVYVTPATDVYTMRYESTYPPYMSSCVGWAKAQVFLNDSLVKADRYHWSTGAEGQEVKGLCPTKFYTVKAIAADGTYVSGTFQFQSDGTVKEAPLNWWVTGMEKDEIIRYDLVNKDYTVEWRLCNGEIVKSDSIQLNLMDCESKESNMVVKDASGNVVYSETISMKAMTTGIKPAKINPTVKLFPNPVSEVLNIEYSGQWLDQVQIEICDIHGRSISIQTFYDIQSGQQISLNVNALPQGIYLCKMLSGKQVLRIEKFSK